MRDFEWGPWKVMYNPMSASPYRVYSKRKDGQPMHSGNIKVHSEWDSRGVAEAVADKLNDGEQI